MYMCIQIMHKNRDSHAIDRPVLQQQQPVSLLLLLLLLLPSSAFFVVYVYLTLNDCSVLCIKKKKKRMKKEPQAHPVPSHFVPVFCLSLLAGGCCCSSPPPLPCQMSKLLANRPTMHIHWEYYLPRTLNMVIQPLSRPVSISHPRMHKIVAFIISCTAALWITADSCTIPRSQSTITCFDDLSFRLVLFLNKIN